MKLFRCSLCANAYLGDGTLSHCPFCSVDGRQLLLGNRALMDDNGISLGPDSIQASERMPGGWGLALGIVGGSSMALGLMLAYQIAVDWLNLRVVADTAEALKRHPAAFPEILLTSSETGEGLPALRAAAAALLDQTS